MWIYSDQSTSNSPPRCNSRLNQLLNWFPTMQTKEMKDMKKNSKRQLHNVQAHGPKVVIQNLDVWWELWSHKGVHCEMATNVTREFLLIIQDERGVGTRYHEINTPSITTYPQLNLWLKLHKRRNNKVIKANIPKNVWMWKYVFHFFVIKYEYRVEN